MFFQSNHKLQIQNVIWETSASAELPYIITYFTFRNHYEQEYINNLCYNHSPISLKNSRRNRKIHHACL